MFSLKNSIRIIIILTVNSFIFIEMGVTLLFKIFGGDSLAKASHDSRQQLDRYAFVFFQFAICLCFPIFVMFCFCVIIIPILYNCQPNLHLNQLQKFNIRTFPRFLETKKLSAKHSIFKRHPDKCMK